MPKTALGGEFDDEMDDLFEAILSFLRAQLFATLESHLVQIFISADMELVTWGQTLGGIPIAYEGPPIEQATNWAREYAAKLVTKMDDETKERLANVVADAIDNKRGVPGLARDIRKEFSDMSKYRSELIAKTETRNALWKGSRERMNDMGVTGKQWYLGSGGATGNCEDCMANASVGVISIDEEFPIPEGDIHPGCTCAIAPAMLER